MKEKFFCQRLVGLGTTCSKIASEEIVLKSGRMKGAYVIRVCDKHSGNRWSVMNKNSKECQHLCLESRLKVRTDIFSGNTGTCIRCERPIFLDDLYVYVGFRERRTTGGNENYYRYQRRSD